MASFSFDSDLLGPVGRPQRDDQGVFEAGDGGHVGPGASPQQVGNGLPVHSGDIGDGPQAHSTLTQGLGQDAGDALDGDGAGVGERAVGPGFGIWGKLTRRRSPVQSSDHADALLSVKIGFDPFTGCLTSRWSWSVTLSPEISSRIRDYRPRLSQKGWDAVAEQVRAIVAATAPATCYEARRLLHAVGRLAVWADQQGLPREPGAWLRRETIDAFVLSGCTGLDGSTIQTYRTWLRRTREALVWVQRGEAPPVRISSPRRPQPPYAPGELAGLRVWAEHLPGQAQRDGLALMALGAGCGLAPGEVPAVRGRHVAIGCGVPVLDDALVGRLVACRASWASTLADLAGMAGDGYLFRPGRKVEAAKNLVSSWPARHRPPAGLPSLSARRLRSTWIVALLADGINPAVVADAAGMSSPAGLAPYHHWVPSLSREEVIRLLHGHHR